MPELATKGDILVVDDTPDNLRVLAAMLERQGHEVRKVLSGKLAIQAAQAAPPDIILLDIRMKEMDGYEVCQRLKTVESLRNIPVIFLSALNDTADKVRAFQVGGVDYITKPFQIEEVLARVNNHLVVRQLQKQLQQHSVNLESQIREHTRRLQKALEYEALLKRITDRVRDSLDETQILQATVQELATGLSLIGCDTGEYNVTDNTLTIRYEYFQAQVPSAQGKVIQLASLPEVHCQILKGHLVQFCAIATDTHQTYRDLDQQYAILGSPLMDERGTIGSIWLFKPREEAFNDLETRLLEQVANQCAIALQQARLYNTAQSQVKELERLNQLKDDFLSTVSHELRTPIANIKLATQMLAIVLKDKGILQENTPNQAAQYFQILQDECDKEIKLITALLDLLRLDSETDPLSSTTIDPSNWLAHLTEPFIARTQAQQQTLSLALPAQLPPITTDLEYLERIITELLDNACKYTPTDETIHISACKQENALHITIMNTGVEISESEQKLIFDKFYRIPNQDPWRYDGIGLGLALVKKLAQRLGATISVISRNNQTTFELAIPLQPTSNSANSAYS